MKRDDRTTLGRREFVRTLGAGAGLAAVAATPIVATEAVAAESGADQKKARYRETDHVKTFYRVNKYPS